ncbi:MAG TPA: hypothetical protein GXZ61_00500 [Clostridiales bacterium]|jgi:hypothetical protein|nr:hypothetical protein [Clostridiales bacterium]
MANEWCACGNNITAGKCLEESMLLIITEKQFNAVADKNADALLMLLPDMCKYEYYLCPKCRRVTALNTKTGKKALIYALERRFPENEVKSLRK